MIERRRVDMEVGLGLGTTEVTSGSVVGACGFLGGVESAEPDSGFFQGIADLGGETAPRSLPNASVPHGSGKGGWDDGGASPFPHRGRKVEQPEVMWLRRDLYVSEVDG
ncbi:hypothetical protein Rs2_24568 [Raphanus sativus]|nr:hypothetical protein Rs2_24555 [Raphanus sativus]KAJ4897774.1 hypothetical protein Rs2_24568 [Raphanus sativus]